MAEEKQEFEVTENTRNLEAQISAAAKPDPQQPLDEVIDLGDEVAVTNDSGTHHDRASEETCPASSDIDDNDAQVCLSQSTSGCCADQVTEGGDCAPVSNSCPGSDGAMDCSGE